LDPPTWTYRSSQQPDPNADVIDDKFEWGVTVGYHNEPDGSQAPDYARVSRWRFETTITTTRMASDFFGARTKAVSELEEVVPVFVELEVAVPHLRPAGW